MAENSEGSASGLTRTRGPGRPFLPGQSGNPGGRPAGTAEFRALCRAQTQTAVDRLCILMQSDDERVALAATLAILAHGHGKPSIDIRMQVERAIETERVGTRQILEQLTPAQFALVRKLQQTFKDALTQPLPTEGI